MIKIGMATRERCLEFFHEVQDEFGEAACWYGVSIDTPDEDRAGDEYDRACRKLQVATSLLFEPVASEVK